MKNVKRGRETTSRELIDEMGDSVLGLFVTGSIPTVCIVVTCVGDHQLRLVSLENDRPVATGYIDMPPDDKFFILTNPQDAIQEFQSRYHLICKAYGLRH